MKFRAIVRIDDAGMACNVGGAVHTEFRTFDFEHPDMAQIFSGQNYAYSQRQIVGVEIIQESDQKSTVVPKEKTNPREAVLSAAVSRERLADVVLDAVGHYHMSESTALIVADAILSVRGG